MDVPYPVHAAPSHLVSDGLVEKLGDWTPHLNG